MNVSIKCNKIWLAKIFLILAIFHNLSWANVDETRIITSRKDGIGFQLGSLRNSLDFQSQHTSYYGESYYSLLGIWLRINPFPAVFVALDKDSKIEGSRRFFLYVPILVKRKILLEFEIAHLKGYRLVNTFSNTEIELKDFKSSRVLGSFTYFFTPNKFSWKHAFSFGERQVRSGGTWAFGGDIGRYSINTGVKISIFLNDSNLIYFNKLSMFFWDGFFGAFYNWIIGAWRRNGKTRILGTGGSLMLGISAQVGQSDIDNKRYSAHKIELFGFVHGSFHMLYTTDRWIFRIYAFARRHTVSPANLFTISNHWANASFQVIYLFSVK
ncbi:MAG: DUF4421 domain-containing protein [Chlorobi bacterium]|nr:DUF4421 domain-containing protein [Chlorobiota bacterium]